MTKLNSMQYAVAMENGPGQLHKLADALAKAQVNILGICSQSLGDVATVRFIAESSQNVKAALASMGLSSIETPVYCVSLRNGPGELARMTRTLAEHGVNILLLYGTADSEEGARIVLVVDKPEKAEKLLASFSEGLVMASR